MTMLSLALVLLFGARACDARRVQTAFNPSAPRLSVQVDNLHPMSRPSGLKQGKFQRSGLSLSGPNMPLMSVDPQWHHRSQAEVEVPLSPKGHKRHGATWRHAATALLSIFVLMGNSLGSQAAIVDMATPMEVVQQQERTIEDLFTKATASVVNIDIFKTSTNPFTMNEVEMAAGTGSGFIWDSEGHIVTNYHVIKDAQSAKVSLTEAPGKKPKKFDASLVGYNPDKDIAVLKIGKEGGGLKPVSIGASAGLRVGATALAIGNPFGLDHTLTVGVISGTGREMVSPSGRPIANVIQTDAAINPGNSGGVLLDSSGRLIGMNTAIQSPSGASAGIGFAIPVDTLKQQVAAIIKDGKVLRTALGINYVQGDQAQALGVERGVLVLNVKSGSGAARAGLRGTSRTQFGDIQLGDVITKVEKTEVNNEVDLFRALDGYKPGQKVTLRIGRLEQDLRGFREVETDVTVELEAMEAV